MDPQYLATMITTAAMRLAPEVPDGLNEKTRATIVDNYEYRLKPLLRQKFGANSRVMESIAKVEVNPSSPDLQKALTKNLAAVHAQNDIAVWAAAHQLHQTFYNDGIHLVIVGNTFQNSPFNVNQGQRTSVRAIMALVLGVVSLLSAGILTGIPAIILGYLALKEIKRSYGQVTGENMAKAGLILGYGSIIALVLGLFLMVALIATAGQGPQQH